MKIAVFGNSHVGMIRAASADPAFARCTFAWMARHTPETHNFKVMGNRLVDATDRRIHAPGLETELNLDEFDAALVLGNTLQINEMVRFLRIFWVTGWGFSNPAVSTKRRGQTKIKQPLTDAAFRAMLIGHIQGNPTHKWLATLRDNTSTPFFVVPPPFARVAVLSPQTERYEAFRLITDPEIFPRLACEFNRAHLEAFQPISDTAVLLQDDSTITDGFFTMEEYSRGSTSLDPDKTYAADDMLHGNDALGRIVLNRVLLAFKKAWD